MQDKIKFSKNHINIFKRMGIQTIYLFGSAAQDKMYKLSDVDIGVVFIDPKRYKNNTLDVYLKIYDIFVDVLPRDYLQCRFELGGHEFDIVFLQFAPIALQFEAIKNGKILYKKDRRERLNYEEYVLKRSCDLKYFHTMRHKAILERI